MPTYLIQSLTQPDIIGESKGLRQALEGCKKAAKESDPVLFQGEISTGKLLLASYLHLESQRSNEPFFVVDCTERKGIIHEMTCPSFDLEMLNGLTGGCIYFHEVTSLSLDEQVHLFDTIQSLESKRIRVFLSSSQNVHLLMVDKAFDKGLYGYASQWEIALLPLRQRKEDILPLVQHYISILNLKLRKSVQGLTPQAEQILLSYRWPGNIAELEQILTRAIIVTNESYISQRHLTENLASSGEDGMLSHGVMPLERMEEILLRSALERYGFTLEGKKRAARALNISLATLYNKVKRYNINA